MKIPFYTLQYAHQALHTEMLKTFSEVYDKHFFVQGNYLATFEQQYAALNGVKHCIGVGNGLDALTLALKVLQIGKNDEVIIPAHTFVATALAVSQTGATPVLADCYLANGLIDTEHAQALITPRTKALIPVHLYGQACNMTAIMALAKQHHLYVVEDNAQAHLATHKTQYTGTFGNVNATSFYPTKNLGALGDGGAITTNDDQQAAQLRALRNYGSTQRYRYEWQGVNSRLDELQAAFLSVKLNYLTAWTAQRQHLAACYRERLQHLEPITLLDHVPDSTHVYHLFVVRTARRDALQQHLAQCGIGTAIHYPIPIHLQEAYQHLGYLQGDFPVAETFSHTCLSLPLYIGLSETDIDEICQCITKFFD